MRWNELWKGIEYQSFSDFLPIEIEDVCASSTRASGGSIFVCIQGTLRDGSDFLEDAWNRGCRCFVIDRRETLKKLLEIDDNILEKACAVLVNDSRETYSLLCRNLFGRPDEKMCIVSITGTKGKTSTASLICDMLKTDGINVSIIGTCGAQWGLCCEKLERTTPDAHKLFSLLERMSNDGVTHVVMEVSSQGLKQKRVSGIRFRVGIFTNLYMDHIGANEHADMEEYFYWKRQLFKQSEMGIIPDPAENRWGLILCDEICGKMPIYFVSGKVHPDGADKNVFWLEKPVEYIWENGKPTQRVSISRKGGGEFLLDIPPGSFWVTNFMFAATCVSLLGFDVNEHFTFKDVPGRMECVCQCGGACFYVDYAHNAESLREALLSLRVFNPRRLICVMGCGGNRSVSRRGPMGEAALRYADLTIITEDNSRDEEFDDICRDILSGISEPDNEYIVIEDRSQAIEYAVNIAKSGDMVLIAGKGHEDYMEKKGKRTHFLDAEEVMKYVICKYHH